MSERRFRIRYADVASTLALLLATSGTVYAATALPRHSVGTLQLKAEAVTAKKVRDGAVTGPKLRDGAVTTSKVADGGLTQADLAPGAVGAAQVADSSLGQADLAEGAVGTSQLGDGAITTVKIGGGQITEGHLAQGAVRSEAVLDESLSVIDIQGAQFNANLAGTSLAADECATYSLGALGAQPGQIALSGWLAAPTPGIVLDARVSAPNQVGLRICNVFGSQVSFPGGSQVIRVVTLG